jgi:hypothetical protein
MLFGCGDIGLLCRQIGGFLHNDAQVTGLHKTCDFDGEGFLCDLPVLLTDDRP